MSKSRTREQEQDRAWRDLLLLILTVAFMLGLLWFAWIHITN